MRSAQATLPARRGPDPHAPRMLKGKYRKEWRVRLLPRFPPSRAAAPALLMTLLMAGALTLAACGSGSGGGAGPATPTPPASATDPAGVPAHTEAASQSQPAPPTTTPPKPAAPAQSEGNSEDSGDATSQPLRTDLLAPIEAAGDTALLRTIGVTVAERRGLPLLRDVPAFLINRDDLPVFFRSFYDDEELADAAFVEAVLRLLGVIRDETGYVPLLQELFVGLVLGFYDFDLQAFVIISSNDGIARRDIATIVHEYVHALQDQHFDLGGAFEATNSNSDAALALRFVVEGDARFAEGLFGDLIAEAAGSLPDARDRLPGLRQPVPTALQEIFNAPYQDGLAAVTRVQSVDGLRGIDALLRNPPPSTEQLLHPDKLASGEPPLSVPDPDLDAALGPAWNIDGADTLGEFFLRVLLREEIGVTEAARAAAGWGGDRLSLYRTAQGDLLLGWRLQWDDSGEGAEFIDLYADWLERRSEGDMITRPDGSLAWVYEGGAIHAAHRGAETWIVVSTDAAAAARVAATFETAA